MVALFDPALEKDGQFGSIKSKCADLISQIRSSFSLPAIVALAVLVGLVGVPIWVLVRASMLQADGSVGFENYVEAYSNVRQVRALWNTFVLGASVCAATALIAVPLAWAVSRTDIGGKSIIRLSTLAVFICPPYLNAVAWIFLAGPNAGWINTTWSALTNGSSPLLNVFSFAGMTFVLAGSLFCFVFTFTTAALDMVSSEMEEAASILGAGKFRIAVKITLPLVSPAILAALSVVFLQAIALYGVPALLAFPARYPVLVTSLMEFFEVLPTRVGVAIAYAMPLIGVTVGLVLFQALLTRRKRFGVVTGKGGQRRLIKLGHWHLPLTIAALGSCFIFSFLPFLVLARAAFSKAWAKPFGGGNLTLGNFAQIVLHPGIRDAVLHSLLYAAVSAALIAVIAVGVAYLVVRKKVIGGWLLNFLAMLPYVLPAIVLSIGFYVAFSAPPLSLYGTGTLLVLAFTARFLPVTYASASAALTTLNVEMEDAARILGASKVTVLLRVTAPLIKRSVIGSTILVFILASHELSTAVFLTNQNNRVVSVAVLDFADNGQMEYVAAIGVALILVTFGLVALGTRLVGRDFMMGRAS